jgi:pimeloyl-ACP methyl ester carboxylesterase
MDPSGAQVADIGAITRTIEIGGERFPAVDVGTGPAVLLLHGFPDSRHLWRYQIPALAAAGFRVVAPDLRGFGDAPRPPALRPYRRSLIVADILGLLDALGVQRSHLIGHDWGAAFAWRLAGSYPERFERAVVLSVGAPSSAGWDTIEQREKSWYFDFFIKPGVAEEALAARDWKLFREWSRGQGDQERYLLDLARPGALTAGLNWYRAAFARPSPDEASVPRLPAWDRIRVPMLGVWSDQDPFLLEPQMTLSAAVMEAAWRYERLRGTGHWMMLDKPMELNRLLLDFLGPSTGGVA